MKATQVIGAIGVALLLLASVAGGISCGVYRWRECRRIHPWWYCASEDKR